jgi:stearoyl-CoA desaturase (delta-9 desaturase)
MLLLSVYATVGSSIAWVGVHRAHHVFTDKPYDPHSPHDGIFKAWTGIGHTETKIPVSFVKDLLRDPLHRIVHDNYFKILLIPIIILFICSPLLGVFLYAIPATLALQTTSIVNVLGHRHGYRSHNTDDRSTNSWLANLISLGEGWHNNHHNKPSNYNIKEKSHEWDLIGWFIERIKI